MSQQMDLSPKKKKSEQMEDQEATLPYFVEVNLVHFIRECR